MIRTASSLHRGEKLLAFAQSARNMAIAADEGREDCVLVSQLALAVRRLAQVLADKENISQEVDFIGQQLQAAARGLQ